MPWLVPSILPTVARNPERPQFFIVTITFLHSDGRTPYVYTEPHVPDQAAIPKLAADWLRQFNKVEKQEENPIFSLPVFQDAVTVLLAEKPEPTPEEIAKQEARDAFIVLVRAYQALKLAFEASAKAEKSTKTTQQDVDDARAAVKEAYIEDYAALLPLDF